MTEPIDRARLEQIAADWEHFAKFYRSDAGFFGEHCGRDAAALRALLAWADEARKWISLPPIVTRNGQTDEAPIRELGRLGLLARWPAKAEK